jgi:hypothetical protein
LLPTLTLADPRRGRAVDFRDASGWSPDRGNLEATRSLIVQVNYEIFSEGTSNLGTVETGKGGTMKTSVMGVATAGALALAMIAAPAPAQAQRGVGVGIAAGLLGGAIVGGALAGPGYYYGPGYGYYGGPAYVAGGGYYGGCYWQRQRFWDGYGWRIRNVRVCG